MKAWVERFGRELDIAKTSGKLDIKLYLHKVTISYNASLFCSLGGLYMACCTYVDSCPISNGKLSASSEVIDFMVDYFCNDRFTKCAVYQAGIVDGAETPDGGACLPGNAMKWFFFG